MVGALGEGLRVFCREALNHRPNGICYIRPCMSGSHNITQLSALLHAILHATLQKNLNAVYSRHAVRRHGQGYGGHVILVFSQG